VSCVDHGGRVYVYCSSIPSYSPTTVNQKDTEVHRLRKMGPSLKLGFAEGRPEKQLSFKWAPPSNIFLTFYRTYAIFLELKNVF